MELEHGVARSEFGRPVEAFDQRGGSSVSRNGRTRAGRDGESMQSQMRVVRVSTMVTIYAIAYAVL